MPFGLNRDELRLVSLVETGCLAHDLGNPPFGHFGEEAIQDWFRLNWRDLSKKATADNRLEELVRDFLYFDGNPQGIRIVTRLQGLNQEDRREFGMDLTNSQILTALKYPRGPLDPPICPGEKEPRWKKAGFFESERRKVEEAWASFAGLFTVQRRFPLAYLVEAADDISYCIGDMEDGIDQRIFSPGQFFEEISPWIDTVSPSAAPLNELRAKASARRAAVQKTQKPSEAKDHFVTFKAAFTGTMIEEAARAYGDGSAVDIREGTRVELLKGTDANDLLEILKLTARHFLYPADRVQRPFLAGLRVTHGILDAYGGILRLSQEDFSILRAAWQSANRGTVSEKKFQTMLPLIDGLPSHYLDVYDSAMHDATSVSKWGHGNWEWFCRAHLIVDYLSGMTDDFAFRTYQVIAGARLD